MRWIGVMLLSLILLGCAQAAGEPVNSAAGPGSALIPPEWVPRLEEVGSLHVHLGMPVAPDEAPQPLHATHPRQRQRIAALLDLLAQSELATGAISQPSRAPTLQIALLNGGAVSVRLAYDCTPLTSESGHGFSCRQAPNQVILHTRLGQDVRLANPGMAAWLGGGWRSEVAVGPAEPLAKEIALEIARELDPKAAWVAVFHDQYPVERKGEGDVRPAWVVETEYPSGHKIRLVIDAVTGEVLRHGQLEAP